MNDMAATVGNKEDQTPEFFEHQTGSFFRKTDWSAFWTSFLISFAVYVWTLAPTVTLEDSGELAVASDYLGVPHPPGYPIWSLVTWFFQWVFHFVKYNGYPNPAWSVGLSSAFFGALACGIMGILISRSGADILRGMEKATKILGFKTENLICWVSGVTGGLLLAFSSVLWSQSTIVEVYSLNAFFLMIVVLLTYWWMCRPKEDNILYGIAFLFGLGFTNHQSLIFIIPGLGAAAFFSDRKLFRDFCAAGLWILAGYLFYKVYKASGSQNPSPEAIKLKNVHTLVAIICLLGPGVMFVIFRELFTEWKRVLIALGLAALGVSFYLYMKFSSDQNPPINWGYPRTMEGFWHAFTRGQYEKINPIANLKIAVTEPSEFFKRVWAIVLKPRDYISVVAQFSLALSLPALIPFIFLPFISKKSRHWMIVSLISFLSLTVLFLIFQWPKLDVQTMFIGRVQYIQAHAIFAMWISYGLMFGLTFLDTVTKGNKAIVYAGVLGVLLLPYVLIHRNYFDDRFIKMVGGSDQNGHTFGWEFGNWQLRGAEGIKSDLQDDLSPEEFEAAWAEYPNPDYPPAMGTNAIFYGGTDPGRFVPTYMIYCAEVRPDVYLITQNALADNTYMSVMRDLYGDTIWIPSQQDSNFAFQKYVEDVQAGRIPPGAAVSFQDGRVSVQGVQGVMMINGILARMIFEANKHKHDFYVEESYVIPWMYPYLEPHGLIMKINAEPLPDLTPEMLKNDREFWDWETKRLLANKKFRHDVVARKTFSKLRSAIAGLYAARHKYAEAEHAFRQAVDLYPLSPEANFRLADVYMQQRRFKEAAELISEFLKEDPDNDKVADFLTQIKQTDAADTRRQELEAIFSQGQGEVRAAFELADLYQKLGMNQRFEQLSMQILNDQSLPSDMYLQIGQMYANAQRYDLLLNALQKYLAREPGNTRVWLDLAAVQTALNKHNEALESLKTAIAQGGEAARDLARKDNRFDPLRQNPAFQKLVPTFSPQQNLSLPFGM